MATITTMDVGNRKIAIAVDLSDESAFAVKWAVANYLRPGDNVILLHVRPTSVLYGADWGAIDLSVDTSDEESHQKLEDHFDAFTSSKASDLSQPLVEGNIPFKIHIVKDHDMKERICLEVERLGVNAVIMGSRGFGASKRNCKSRLGSVSDYCVRHCVCPVVVVRFPEETEAAPSPDQIAVLHEVPEEDEGVPEDQDQLSDDAEEEEQADDVQKEQQKDGAQEEKQVHAEKDEQRTDVVQEEKKKI